MTGISTRCSCRWTPPCSERRRCPSRTGCGRNSDRRLPTPVTAARSPRHVRASTASPVVGRSQPRHRFRGTRVDLGSGRIIRSIVRTGPVPDAERGPPLKRQPMSSLGLRRLRTDADHCWTGQGRRGRPGRIRDCLRRSRRTRPRGYRMPGRGHLRRSARSRQGAHLRAMGVAGAAR